MKKAMNIAGKIVSGLLVCLLLFNLYFVIASKLNGGQPKVLGHELMTVLSGSMSPEFETGSLIAVKPADGNTEYQTGDVITFRADDNANVIITHRVLEVTEENGQLAYVTKGDANETADPTPVYQAQVIGKYNDFQIPWLGYAMNWVKTKQGMAVMLITPGLLLIFSPMVALFRMAMKAEKKESEQSV